MIRFILATIFVSIQCAFAIEMRVPEAWSQVESPTSDVQYGMPPTIRPMIRLLPPERNGFVSIAEMEVTISLDEAAKIYGRGLPARGWVVESMTKVSHNGHEGIHIRGNLTLPVTRETFQTFPGEVYIIMTQECILSVEAVGTESSLMINEVLSWIVFPSKTPNTTGAAGWNFWAYLGIGVVFLAVGYAIFNSKSHSQKKNG